MVGQASGRAQGDVQRVAVSREGVSATGPALALGHCGSRAAKRRKRSGSACCGWHPELITFEALRVEQSRTAKAWK